MQPLYHTVFTIHTFNKYNNIYLFATWEKLILKKDTIVFQLLYAYLVGRKHREAVVF